MITPAEIMARNMCLSLLAGVIIGIVIGALGMNSTWKKAAIECNAAKYVITSELTGATEFKWNTELEVKK